MRCSRHTEPRHSTNKFKYSKAMSVSMHVGNTKQKTQDLMTRGQNSQWEITPFYACFISTFDDCSGFTVAFSKVLDCGTSFSTPQIGPSTAEFYAWQILRYADENYSFGNAACASGHKHLCHISQGWSSGQATRTKNKQTANFICR